MNVRYVVFSILALSGIFVGLLYRNIQKLESEKRSKPNVICTTTMLADAIRSIARESVQLEVLMGPGVDPHTYKPIERDLIKIAQADLIIYQGLHLEARMTDLFDHLATQKTTLCSTKNITPNQLIYPDHQEHIPDPHIWFDPNLWTNVITTITDQLCLLCPKHTSTYQHNRDIAIHNLKQLHQSCLKKISVLKKNQKILITSHDAFSYFARVYDFQVISMQGINTAAQASIADIQKIAHTIADQKIPTIFIESSMPTRMMQALQQRVKALGYHVHIGPELYADSLGEIGSQQATFLGMMDYNVATIVQGLTQ